jgi:Rrf2 family protein
MAKHEVTKMSARYLHEKLDIPYSYLRQILGRLSKNGFITSTRGRDGGFFLGKEVSAIFLSDIIDAIEGLDSFSRCIMGFRECPFGNLCAMHPVWVKMRSEILNVLDNTSLADLLKNTNENQSTDSLI